MVLFIEEFKIAINGMEHQPTQCSTYNIGQKVPIITNSVGGEIVLNEFYGNGIDDGNNKGNDSDFVKQKGEAPLFNKAQHDEIYQDRKYKSVSQLVCWNTEQGLRLEPAVTGSA